MKRYLLSFAMLAGLWVMPAPAQTADTSDGKQIGSYQVQQSIEFGYRFTDVTGSTPLYDTFIDQHEGPRLMQQTLSMRSPEHNGALFDNLFVSSFGWGGDPENVAQARMSKARYYDFRFSFRRDKNYFDYDLLANPLNPPTSSVAIPVNFSPHSMYNTRRMYDTDLTLMPQSKISVRLGYSHNRSNGPTFSSFHEGTDVLLNQAWNVTDNLFRIGVDVKVFPRTVLSYDQFFDYAKNDTDYSLGTFATFLLPNGNPVELGLPWNTAAGSPCALPIRNGAVNPSCNGYYSYLRNQRFRTSTPTEQLTLTSNYFRRMNLVARGAYSSTDMNDPYSEFFDGLVTRTQERQFTFSGPANGRRVAVSSDLGATVELTKTLRLSDSFRFDNWRIPASWDSVATATVGIPTGTPPAVTLLSGLGAVTTTTDLTATFLGMRTLYNLFQVEYNPSRRAGVHVGYKLRYRRIFKAEPESVDPEAGFEPFEGDTINVREHGPVFGVWLRPVDALRINVEAEALTTVGCQATCPNSDQIFIARISPRQRQNYRGRVTYKPVRWADLSGSVNWWESGNGEVDTQYNQHYRNAGAILSLFPNEKISLELGYNYTDALQNAYICYNGTFNPSGTVVNGCPTYDPANASDNPNPNWIYSRYTNNTHYFSGTVLLKPTKKLAANLGYGLIKTDGSTTILNALQPLGPLQYTYHQPLGSLSYEVVKDWSVNAYWNYDQYNEGSFTGPTAPRYFHDNRTVLSLKYAF
jgi:hypothetical protein